MHGGLLRRSNSPCKDPKPAANRPGDVPDSSMKTSFARSAIVLGLLTAVGPFAIDMYLPALPTIAADLHTTESGAQATLIGYFIAVALCQVFYGPVSDSFGRKPPLYFGM